MKKNSAHTPCTQRRPRAGSPTLPAPAVVIVVVVLLLTAGLVAGGLNTETVIATISAAGLLSIELIRRLSTVSTGHTEA